MYVPQRPSLLPDTPADFLSAVSQLQSRQAYAQEKGENRTEDVLKRAISVGRAWGIPPELWTRDWMKLSGGEGQRVLIAAALSLNTAEVLLLDGASLSLFSLKHLEAEYDITSYRRTYVCTGCRNVVASRGFHPGQDPVGGRVLESCGLDHPLCRTEQACRNEVLEPFSGKLLRDG